MDVSKNFSELADMRQKSEQLHRAHQMNEQQKKWFQNTPEPFPFQFSAPNQRISSTLNPKYFQPSQFFFDMAGTCMEKVSSDQTSYQPGYVSYQYLQPGQLIYVQEEGAPYLMASAPHMDSMDYNMDNVDYNMDNMDYNIINHVDYNIINHMEINIVQYVYPCRIINSNLNPNAEVFTPMAKTMVDPKNQKVLEEKDCSDDNNTSKSFDRMHPVTDKEENLMEEKNCEVKTKQISVIDDHISNYDLVQCSDIIFCDSNIQSSDIRDDTFSDNEEKEEAISEDEDEDDDSEWDCDDQSLIECVESDAEFDDLFTSPLMITKLRVCNPKSKSPDLPVCPQICPEFQQDSKHQSTSRHANIDVLLAKQLSCGSCKKIGKSVQFCEEVKIIEEPEDLAEDLHKARSDFSARQADKARNERMLTPIFSKEHREKIYQNIYGDYT